MKKKNKIKEKKKFAFTINAPFLYKKKFYKTILDILNLLPK